MTPEAAFHDNPVLFAAMLAYALATMIYVSGTTRLFRITGNTLVVTGVALLAVVTHTQLSATGNWGASAAPLMAAMIGIGAIAADRWLGVRVITVFLVPLGMLVLLVRFFTAPTPSVTPSVWLTGLHVAMALAGQVMAIAACVLSIIYLWQHNALKQRKILELGARTPSLERLDQWQRVALLSGFIMLTLSLLTGALFVTTLPGGIAPTGAMAALFAKILWAVAVWAWYLATLVARNVLRAPVRIVARMSVAGFALMALAWFGLIFVAAKAPLTSIASTMSKVG